MTNSLHARDVLVADDAEHRSRAVVVAELLERLLLEKYSFDLGRGKNSFEKLRYLLLRSTDGRPRRKLALTGPLAGGGLLRLKTNV